MVIVCGTEPIKLCEVAGGGLDSVADNGVLERAEVSLPASRGPAVAFELTGRLPVALKHMLDSCSSSSAKTKDAFTQ
jgi:hypothetical protein